MCDNDDNTISIAVVVPCYNEDAVVNLFYEKVSWLAKDWTVRGKQSVESVFVFVDDGSTDSTWECLVGLCNACDDVVALRFSRNFGQRSALLAGYDECIRLNTDVVISIDVDLQDDPTVIQQMIDAWCEGADIVFGIRDDRSSDSWMKRSSSGVYHAISSKLGVPSMGNMSEFSLMSRKAVEAFLLYGERDIYMRGVRASLGFNTAVVTYKRAKRVAGDSKYTLSKLVREATVGIFSFSSVPLRIVSCMAGISVLGAIFVLVWSIAQFVCGNAIPGWTSLMVSLWMIGAMVLVSLSVIGAYVERIFIESKARPRYILSDRLVGNEFV